MLPKQKNNSAILLQREMSLLFCPELWSRGFSLANAGRGTGSSKLGKAVDSLLGKATTVTSPTWLKHSTCDSGVFQNGVTLHGTSLQQHHFKHVTHA